MSDFDPADDEPIEAETVEAFHGTVATDDGRHVLISITVGGEDKVLAFPADEALPLAFSVLGTEGTCRSVAHPENRGTPLVPVQSYQLGLDADGEPVVTFEGPNGGHISFVLPSDALSRLIVDLGTLKALAGTEGQTRQ